MAQAAKPAPQQAEQTKQAAPAHPFAHQPQPKPVFTDYASI